MQYNIERNNENYNRARELVEVEGLTAFAAAQKLGLNDRTVQDWARKDGWDKSAINARRRAKRAQKRAASTERRAAPAPARRAPASQPPRQAIQRREGWGAVIEHHQPSHSPASREMAEPDEYFDQSEQMELYNRHGWHTHQATDQQLDVWANGITDRIGKENAVRLGHHLTGSRREQIRQRESRPVLVVGGSGLGASEHAEWMHRNRLALMAGQAHQQNAPPQKSLWQHFKDWLNGSNDSTNQQPSQQSQPMPHGHYSPYNCQYCGSCRLSFGHCLDCGLP